MKLTTQSECSMEVRLLRPPYLRWLQWDGSRPGIELGDVAETQTIAASLSIAAPDVSTAPPACIGVIGSNPIGASIASYKPYGPVTQRKSADSKDSRLGLNAAVRVARHRLPGRGGLDTSPSSHL